MVNGEDKVNNHIRAKILNLVKNKKEEVVWTIQQDHSFINLTYELRQQQVFIPKKPEHINTGKNITIKIR